MLWVLNITFVLVQVHESIGHRDLCPVDYISPQRQKFSLSVHKKRIWWDQVIILCVEDKFLVGR